MVRETYDQQNTWGMQSLMRSKLESVVLGELAAATPMAVADPVIHLEAIECHQRRASLHVIWKKVLWGELFGPVTITEKCFVQRVSRDLGYSPQDWSSCPHLTLAVGFGKSCLH